MPTHCFARRSNVGVPLLVVMLALATFATPRAFAQTNLLQNGSFESSYFNDTTASSQGIGYVSNPPGGTSGRATVPSWTWTAGAYSPSTFALNTTGGALQVPSQDGTFSVSFGTGSAQGGGSIVQAFAPDAGAHCTLTFWVRRIGGGQGIAAVVQVVDNATQSAVALVDSGGTSHGSSYAVPIPAASNVWSQVTVTFVAPSSDLTFVFSDTTGPNAADSTDLGLDNVSVTQKTLQTLKFYGGVGNQGDVAANTEYSNDGDVTWHTAYLSGNHPWGCLPGTNSWINQSSSPFVGLYQTTDFRIKFNLPAEFEGGSMSFQVNADNHGELSINSTVLSSTDGGFSPSVITANGSSLLPGQVNILKIRLTDYGGWVGINYVLTLTGYAYSAPSIVQLPPVITGSLSASGTVGAPFAYALAGGNTPTSFGAANLPAGLSIDAHTGVISGTPTTIGTYNVPVSETNSGGTTTGSLVITIQKGAASLALGGLSQVYDGTAKSATATTNPANLDVSFSYTGAALPPVNAGVYGVMAVISDPNYSGSAIGNMTITPAALSVTFGNLTQTYDGAAHSVTVATSPAGVATTAVTYNGSTTAPTNVGNYTVAATSADANYTGGATATLTVAPATVSITLGTLTQAFDGTPKSVQVTATPADVPVAVTYNGSATAPSAIGSYTVSATSASPNYAGTATATLEIKDMTAPVINLDAGAIAVEATLAAGAPVSFTGSATDNVDGTDAVTYSIAPGSVFPIGSTTVTATSRDAAGNTATTSFPVTVSDTTAPVITGDPLSIETFAAYSGIQNTLQFQSNLKVAYSGAVAGWNGSGLHAIHAVDRTGSGDWAVMIYNDNAIVQSAGLAANDAGANYAVTFVASPAVYADANQATAADDGVVVQVLRADNTVLASYTAQPGAWAGNLSFSGYSFGYTGDGSGPVRLRVSSLHPDDGRFAGAIDDLAVSASAPADLSLEATSAEGATATFRELGLDRVSGYTSVTATPASGSTFPIGKTAVTLTTTDAHGNVATAAFNVTVHDTTGPVISAPGDILAEATSAQGAFVTFAATANDLVDGAVSVTASPASGSTFAIGTTAVTLTATDAHNNTSTAKFAVIVRDTTAPVIAAQENLVVEATSADGAKVEFKPTANDTVNGSVPVAASPASGSTFPLGTTTVTLLATDAAGNTAKSNFTVTVRDTTAPTLSVPADLTLEATSASGAVAAYAATATDTVTASPAIAYSIAPGSTFPIGTTAVTVTATDAAGNVSRGTFKVTVRDTTAPKIGSVTASPSSLWPPNKKMVAVAITAPTSDTVGVASVKIVSVSTNEPDGTTQWQITGDLTLNLKADRRGDGNGRIYTITVEARDAAGNASRQTVTVSVPHDQGK